MKTTQRAEPSGLIWHLVMTSSADRRYLSPSERDRLHALAQEQRRRLWTLKANLLASRLWGRLFHFEDTHRELLALGESLVMRARAEGRSPTRQFYYELVQAMKEVPHADDRTES